MSFKEPEYARSSFLNINYASHRLTITHVPTGETRVIEFGYALGLSDLLQVLDAPFRRYDDNIQATLGDLVEWLQEAIPRPERATATCPVCGDMRDLTGFVSGVQVLCSCGAWLYLQFAAGGPRLTPTGLEN